MSILKSILEIAVLLLKAIFSPGAVKKRNEANERERKEKFANDVGDMPTDPKARSNIRIAHDRLMRRLRERKSKVSGAREN